jgi:hypothetical protein
MGRYNIWEVQLGKIEEKEIDNGEIYKDIVPIRKSFYVKCNCIDKLQDKVEKIINSEYEKDIEFLEADNMGAHLIETLEDIQIKDIKKINLNPDDILEFKINGSNVPADEIEKSYNQIKEILKKNGYDNDVIVSTPEVEFKKYIKEE